MVVIFNTVNNKAGITRIGILKDISDLTFNEFKTGVQLNCHKRFELIKKKAIIYPTIENATFPTFAFSPSIPIIEDALLTGRHLSIAFHGDMQGLLHAEIAESLRKDRDLELYVELLHERNRELEEKIISLFNNVEEYYKKRADFFAATKKTLWGGGLDSDRWESRFPPLSGYAEEQFEPSDEGLMSKMRNRFGSGEEEEI
tara:strand:- start:123 stop:725 length:603 start_codon:yes stop_codon:yes gene_type:complete